MRRLWQRLRDRLRFRRLAKQCGMDREKVRCNGPVLLGAVEGTRQMNTPN